MHIFLFKYGFVVMASVDYLYRFFFLLFHVYFENSNGTTFMVGGKVEVLTF